jgi:hypothetical protein
MSRFPIADRQLLVRVLTASVLALLPILFFFPAVFGNVALVPGDGWTQNFGVRVLIGRMIAAGEWPLWNPYIFAGTPLLASIYPGALYPPNWIFAVLSPATAIDLLVITTYHIALTGTYLYARKIGSTRAAALIAGMAFTFGGYLVCHLGHTSRIAAAAWLPWILLALEELYIAAKWRWVTLGSAFIALQLLAGEPQMTCYTVLVAGSYWLFSLIARTPHSRRRFAIMSIAMAICGALLSMIQLLPSRELLRQGQRIEIPYEYFSGGSFPRSNVFTLIIPFFFGGANSEPYKVPFWGVESFVETCGYAGLLTLLLCSTALWTRAQRRLVGFWAGILVVSMLLAWGNNIPFGINHLLHRLPIYNLFRVTGRHMFEFTFSAGVLAALGLTALSQADWLIRRRTYVRGALVFAGAVFTTVIVYRFSGSRLVSPNSRPAISVSLLEPETLFPIAFALLSLMVLGLYSWRPAPPIAVCLVVLLFLDLCVAGWAYEWRTCRAEATVERAADSPTVRLIKERERDLNSFRVFSYSTSPFAETYNLLNYPNVAIVRGLGSLNGYDALRLTRMSKVAGDMTIEGLATDRSIFGPSHRGLELFNVKYLLYEQPRTIPQGPQSLMHGGIPFDGRLLDLSLTRQSSHTEFHPRNSLGTTFALVSSMSNSGNFADGMPITTITVHTVDGGVIKGEFQAGRDTSEWAFDRADVATTVKHKRARIAESFNAGTFEGHRYLTWFDFPRSSISKIELDYLPESGSLEIGRVSLFDFVTGLSTPLDLQSVDPAIWRPLDRFGSVELLERVSTLPRAWFVKRAVALHGEQVLSAVKTGKLLDGSVFDPADTVLFETEDFGGKQPSLPEIGDPAGSEVRVISYDAHRIELETTNAQPGFLVLSEIYYRGWEARVDGNRTPVEKVNYTFRGVALPTGKHRVEFVFLAHTFRNGAIYSGIGLVFLVLGGIWHRWRSRNSGID